MDRIKELEKEIELLKQLIELQQTLDNLKQKNVPVYPYYPPIYPYPITPYPITPYPTWTGCGDIHQQYRQW